MKKTITMLIAMIVLVVLSVSVSAVNTQLTWDDLTTNHREFTIGDNVHYTYYVNTQTTDDVSVEIKLKNNNDLIYDVNGDGYEQLLLELETATNVHSINKNGQFSTSALLLPYFDNLQAGDYTITAVGRDSSTMVEAELTFTLVDEEVPTLVVELFCPENVEINSNLVCDVRVTDIDNNLIENAFVNADIGYVTDASSCTTNSRGMCTITYLLTEANGFAANEESGIYAEATKDSYEPGHDYVTFNVQEETISNNAPYWIDNYENVDLSITQTEFNIYDLINNAIDPDGDALFFEVTQTGTAVSCSIVNEDDLHCVVNELGYSDVILEVTDGELSDFTTFRITILDETTPTEEMRITLDCEDTVLINEELTCVARVTEELTLLQKLLSLLNINIRSPVPNANVWFEINNPADNFIAFYGTTDANGYITFNKEILDTLGYLPGSSYIVTATATKTGYTEVTATDVFTIVTLIDAVITNPEDPYYVTQEVRFDGYDSIGSDGNFESINSCEWTINQIAFPHYPHNYSDRSNTIKCYQNYTFDEAGIYRITLKIRDRWGIEDTETITVIVSNDINPEEGPTAIITGPTSSTCRQEVIFSGSNSYTDDTSVITSYTWSIENNEGEVLVDSWSGSAVLPYVFDERNSYTVTLTVTDSQGLSDEATHTIVIECGEEIPVLNMGFSDAESGIKVLSFSIRGFDESRVYVGGDFEMEAVIENIAGTDLDDVRMTFYLPEYGIKFKSSARDFDDGERKTLTVVGYMPYDIEPNVYYPLIGVSDDHIRRVKVGYLEVVAE